MFKKLMLAPIAMALAACGGSSSDPKTEARSDLNPPSGLTSVSAPAAGKIELRWNAVNTEKEFKGYHVFGIKSSIAALAGKAKYPASADLASQSLPRCEDNNELFKAFGFTKDSTKGCKGDTATDDKFTSGSDLKMADEEEKLLSASPCAANSAEGISYSATPSTKATHVCAVSKVWNGTALEDMVAGETYTFFVVSVLGDSLNKISWTSNFIQDTPPTSVFSGDVKLGEKKAGYFEFDLAALGTALTATAFDNGGTDCTSPVCSIYEKNSVSMTANSGKARFYLGRGTNASGAHAQRIVISAPNEDNGGKLSYAYRGRQTLDPANPSVISTSIPGDQAATATNEGPYITNGIKTVVYGNQVFDLRFTNGSVVNYGKVIIKDPTYASDTQTAEATVNVTILIQTKVDTLDYFMAN